jgi:predicted transcriptional regulator of viral defense system
MPIGDSNDVNPCNDIHRDKTNSLDFFYQSHNNVCKTLGFPEGTTHMRSGPDYNLLYEIAEGQAGYFTAYQARSVGFSWERLSENVKTGRFRRVAHGIYRLSRFPISQNENYFVAWLRTRPDSVISHESALSVYNLSDDLPDEIHVIIPRTGSRRRQGLRLHTNRIGKDEITICEGLPITTVERTIADVAFSGLAADQVQNAIKGAIYRGLTTRQQLIAMADRRGGRVMRIFSQVLG